MKNPAAACALTAVVLLSGCASLDVGERIAFAEKLAVQHRFASLDVTTSRFDLRAFLGPQRRNGVLRVYIEGDGFAWVTRHQPSKNPTPHNPVALKLAVLDPHDTAYLARPCQYVAMGDRCHPRYWTSARFSSDVVDAMDQAITTLKQTAKAERLVLIGYSGGGTIAALVAARRSDVERLVTVAGNLDPTAWARLHAVPELRGSLNPKGYTSSLARIPQRHFVGGRDDIVPIHVYESYRAGFSTDADISVKILPDADHGCCWPDIWPQLLNELR